MAFTIPNHADANTPFQAEPDSVDFDVLAAGYSGSGVISGCAVTAQGSPNMTVAVASGIVSVAGVRVAVSGANATIGTADGTNPRFDMITINSSGTIATTAGTAAAVPELPNIPSVSIVLALIFVPADDTTIATAQITDKRIFITASGGVLDNIIMGIGSDSDIAILNRSTLLAADAEVTNVIEGTSDHLGVAANSLIVSNVTNDGDIMFVVSDGGNSKGLLKLDGANGRVVIHGGDLLMSGAQKIYFYDVGGEYMSSDGSTLTITGATALTPTIGSTSWANANHAHAASNSGGTISATASSITVTDNEDTAEENLLTFVAGAATATGTHGLEMDGNLAYNPSTGSLSSTVFIGNLTGNASGTALTVTQAAQGSITSLGTLTGLTLSGDLTLTGAAVDVDLIDDNASAISFDSAGKAGILAIVTTDGSEAVTMSGALTVTGNLTVNGTTTTLDTATLAVEDPLIILASGNNAADALDIGLYGLYDTSGSQDLYSGLFRDANDSGKWKLFKDLQVAPTTTVNTSGTGYAVGTLVATLEGSVATAAQTAITSVGTLSALAVSGTAASTITSTANAVTLASQSTSAAGILLHANGGTSETIKIHSDQGTGNDSINLLSDAGGITMDVADGKLIKLGGATVFDDEISVAYNSGNPLVDCTKGNKFTVDMTGNVTSLFFTNPGGTVSGNYMVRLVHNGGARTIGNYYHTGGTTKVHFAAGTKPTLTAATNAEDILALYWDGASFHATIMLDSKAYS